MINSSKLLVGCLIFSFSVPVFSEITKSMQTELGIKYTPMGANPNANADGSIPKWTGLYYGLPPELKYEGPGSVYPDPFGKEKPVLTITGKNYQEHKGRLSDGMIALFEKYPETYKMDVYPTHRDFRYHDQMVKRTQWNVGNSKFVNGIDGLQGFTGGAPFPIPENGAHVMWNARVNYPTPVADGMYDEIAVYSNGSHLRFRSKLLVETPLAYESHPVGKTTEEIGDVAAYVFYKVLEPKRKKGEMAIVHEPLDQVKFDRKAWIYIPGAKRVKRAPNVGYDTPIGPGGMMTIDDGGGFNGAMDRYDWKLLGKQEMYIPFHNYRFDSPKLNHKKLLPARHANPEYIRYELHRVWVVEATLKEGERHVYARRRFYMAEDTWLIAVTDAWDGRGDLWRVGLINSLYDFHVKGYILRTHLKYDLTAGAYVAMGLVNETRPTNFAVKPKGDEFYTPNNLRKMGRR